MDKERSIADRAVKVQTVTFISGLSKEELDKPKLQRIPTPYYEHLHQATTAESAGMADGEATKGSPGVKEAPEATGVASDPEPPAQVEPSGPGGDDPTSPRADGDAVGDLRQGAGPPTKSAPSTTRRITREFSMSRDD